MSWLLLWEYTVNWGEIRNKGFITVAGNRYDLSHLQDRHYHFEIPGSGTKSTLRLTLLVQYSSHCVSWGPKHDQPIDFARQGEDRRIVDDKGVSRCFCASRFELSRHLPTVFAHFPERKCFFTGHSNWLTIELLGPDHKPVFYEVFFSLSRQSRSFLRAYVESAYVRNIGFNRTRLKRDDKIRGKMLLAKKARGEPIRRPR